MHTNHSRQQNKGKQNIFLHFSQKKKQILRRDLYFTRTSQKKNNSWKKKKNNWCHKKAKWISVSMAVGVGCVIWSFTTEAIISDESVQLVWSIHRFLCLVGAQGINLPSLCSTWCVKGFLAACIMYMCERGSVVSLSSWAFLHVWRSGHFKLKLGSSLHLAAENKWVQSCTWLISCAITARISSCFLN